MKLLSEVETVVELRLIRADVGLQWAAVTSSDFLHALQYMLRSASAISGVSHAPSKPVYTKVCVY